MNYPQIMSPVPFSSKSGGHVPQIPRERRPWLRRSTRQAVQAPLAPSPSEIWCISMLKLNRLAEYSMQYEIYCRYFVQKVERLENKTVLNPKSGGHVSPSSLGFALLQHKQWRRQTWARGLAPAPMGRSTLTVKDTVKNQEVNCVKSTNFDRFCSQNM